MCPQLPQLPSQVRALLAGPGSPDAQAGGRVETLTLAPKSR